MLRKSRLHFLIFTFVLAAVVALSVSIHTSAAGNTAANGIKVTMNGSNVQPKSAPFIDNGTVYLPVRDIGELLGTSVSWIASAKTVTMNYPELTVKLTYGSTTASVNGKIIALTAPLRIVDGQIFVPLRFFSEATGASVKWQDSIKTVNIARSDDFVKQNAWSAVWLNRKTGDLYMARDEQSSAIHLGKLDGAIKGNITFQGGFNQGGNTVLTVVDNYGEPRNHYDAYGLLIHDNKIVSQKKASYDKRYEENVTYYQVYDPNGWIQYTVLTDGRIVYVFNEQGKEEKKYNLPELAGADDVYSVLAIGADYLEVRPNRTGLLTLIDLKDQSTVVLADKLLTGKDLAYAHDNEVPYRGDTLTYAGDIGNGVMDFFYYSPFADKNDAPVRLSYERPSYEEERNALPKGRSISELASVCTVKTIKSVNMQDGDQIYIPLNGANEEDKDSINAVCGILKKFAAKGAEMTLPTVTIETFFHGMEIFFTEGDYVSIYEAGGGRLALGSGEGGKTVVLTDPQAVHDFERLKVLPSVLAISPNPAHFGEKLHFKGNNGDSGESTPLIVSWAPIVGRYSSSDPDPSLIIYTGTTKYGRYDVNFAMPAYGKASDGTLKKVQSGKGIISISGSVGGWGGTTFVELLPASSVFLSVNGVPSADPLLAPITASGHVLVPVRAIAKLTGQPVAWDEKTGSILIRTKPSVVKGASKAGAELWIDGKKAAADLQPIVRKGTVYMPIRAVSAAFGLPVAWDSISRCVNVTVASPPKAGK